MKSVFVVLLMSLLGPGMLAIGIYSLRRGAWRESIPALELLLDRATGVEPPPRTAWDRRFAYFQCWMNIVLGSFFSLCLIAIILSFVL